MSYLRKYGVQNIIRIPLIKAGSTNHAVSADWSPTTSDVKLQKDGAGWNNIGTLPTATAAGNSAVWNFTFSATEMQASGIEIMISDAATKAIEDDFFSIETYGNASALFAIDYSDQTSLGLTNVKSNVISVSGTALPSVQTAGYFPVDWANIGGKTANVNFTNTTQSGIGLVDRLTTYTGNTVQTGDNYARIGNGGINLTSIAASSLLGNTVQTGDSYTRIGNGGINLTSIAASSLLGNTVQTGDSYARIGNAGINLTSINISGFSNPGASGLANIILSQSVRCTENTAPSGSLTELILGSLNSSVSANTLHILRSDGTDFSTKSLTLTAGATPIRGIS